MLQRVAREYVIAPWTADLELGIPEIDDQHQSLVKLVNRLWSGIINKSNSADVLDILKELHSYTKSHFTAEEVLMRVEKYPNVSKHRAEHKAFIAELVKVQKMVVEKKPIEMELLQFLTSWLTNHIKGSDKQYSVFVMQKANAGLFTKLFQSFKKVLW